MQLVSLRTPQPVSIWSDRQTGVLGSAKTTPVCENMMHVAWRPPVPENIGMIGKKLMSKEARSELDLATAWLDRHKTICQDSLPKLPGRLAKQRHCMQLGCCICSQARRPLRLFYQHFVVLLKDIFNPDRAVPLRPIFKSNRGVLRLEWNGNIEEWLHLAYVNQKTWSVTVLRLKRDTDPSGGTVTSQMVDVGRIAAVNPPQK